MEKIIWKEGTCIFFIIFLLNKKDHNRIQISFKSLLYSVVASFGHGFQSPHPWHTHSCVTTPFEYGLHLVISNKQNTTKVMDVASTINLQNTVTSILLTHALSCPPVYSLWWRKPPCCEMLYGKRNHRKPPHISSWGNESCQQPRE